MWNSAALWPATPHRFVLDERYLEEMFYGTAHEMPTCLLRCGLEVAEVRRSVIWPSANLLLAPQLPFLPGSIVK